MPSRQRGGSAASDAVARLVSPDAFRTKLNFTNQVGGYSAASDAVVRHVGPGTFASRLDFNNRFQTMHGGSPASSSVLRHVSPSTFATRLNFTNQVGGRGGIRNINALAPPSLGSYTLQHRKGQRGGGVHPLIVGPDYYEAARPVMPHGVRGGEPAFATQYVTSIRPRPTGIAYGDVPPMGGGGRRPKRAAKPRPKAKPKPKPKKAAPAKPKRRR